MQIYILHGYVDGLTDPVVSTDYSIVYDAMKTAYEEAIDDAEQTPDELECSFLEGYSATAVATETGTNGRSRLQSFHPSL